MNDQSKLAKALYELKLRGVRVERRLRYYDGNHPCESGTEAWKRNYRARFGTLIENQCRLVVDTHAEAVMPVAVHAKTDDKVETALALWVTERIIDEGHTFATSARSAKAAGEQKTVVVDFDADGEINFYPLDPRSCYVQLDRGGSYLWAVHFWKADSIAGEAMPTQATLYLPGEIVHYSSVSTNTLPDATDFREVERIPNPQGELQLAVVDEAGSIIDTISPINDALNKSLQTQQLTGEKWALPLRVWFGLLRIGPDGELLPGPKAEINEATGSRDVAFPTVADDEGDKRSVVQLPSADPTVFGAEQNSFRASIARLSNIPASYLQVDGATQPASGVAMEYSDKPNAAHEAADRRVWAPFYNRLARLAIAKYLYKHGITTPAPAVKVVFAQDSLLTPSVRMDNFVKAKAAGMTLADALVEFLGWGREAADIAQGNTEAQGAAAADRATALMDQGFIG